MDCQGDGGRGGGSGGGGGGGGAGIRGHNLGCVTDTCNRNLTYIIFSAIGLYIFFQILFCCRYNKKGRSSNNNSVFIDLIENNTAQELPYVTSPFQSGTWLGRYYQHEKWHEFHQYRLSFDFQTMKVTGTGRDDVGVFTINGIYSNKTNRLGLTKKYQAGTGNPRENLGHQVIIQLTWNASDHQFVGKWYVQTEVYHGQNNFELKFIGQPQVSVNKSGDNTKYTDV